MNAYTIAHIMLDLVGMGMSVEEVARETHRSRRTVYRYLKLARSNPDAKLPKHLPRNWALEHVDEKPCDHDEIPIPRGDACYCAYCSKSGYDGHPQLVTRPELRSRKKPKSLAQRRWKADHDQASV